MSEYDMIEFANAVALVEKAVRDGASLNFEEGMRINAACALLAVEYVKVRHRIMPA